MVTRQSRRSSCRRPSSSTGRTGEPSWGVWAAAPPGIRFHGPPTIPEVIMQTVKFVHWQDGDAFLGYLLDYPDYWTQGDSPDDLTDHLADLYQELSSGELPGIRKVDEW